MRYRKGDIVVIEFPFSNLEGKKKRPALIISNDIVNKTGDYLMVQVTSKIRKDDLSLILNKDDFKEGKDLPLRSCLRLHKIFLLNRKLVLTKYTSVTEVFLKSTTQKIIDLFE